MGRGLSRFAPILVNDNNLVITKPMSLEKNYTNLLGILRRIRDDEVELMLSWRNEPSVRLNMYTRHEISWNEHINWWNRVCSDEKNQYFMFESDSKPLGIIGFNQIDEINSNCSWAFYSSPRAPRGTGSRMEFLAIDYAFNNLNLHKLYCEVLSFNSSVIKLHEKFGFKVEGVFREHHLHEGTFIDIYRLGLLDFEWLNVRHTMLERLVPRVMNSEK
jgi:UDP-4-amino-4,6-dideoxy-N-acetyl-beta-L-altrosamine N-acetyltransferase